MKQLLGLSLIIIFSISLIDSTKTTVKSKVKGLPGVGNVLRTTLENTKKLANEVGKSVNSATNSGGNGGKVYKISYFKFNEKGWYNICSSKHGWKHCLKDDFTVVKYRQVNRWEDSFYFNIKSVVNDVFVIKSYLGNFLTISGNKIIFTPKFTENAKWRLNRRHNRVEFCDMKEKACLNDHGILKQGTDHESQRFVMPEFKIKN